jgi:hypothetical protein
MKAELHPCFGSIPVNAENLEIVGVYHRRFEEKSWPTVWPRSGVIRWADGEIETETIWQKAHLQQCGDYHSKWSVIPEKRKGRYFNLSLFWSTGYYHWICDVLPRLHGILPQLMASDMQVIVPPNLAAWQERSLELVGLPREKWLRYHGKRPWRVEHLFYASPVSMTGDHEPESLRWLQQTMWQKCLGTAPEHGGWRKLYLTRKGTWSRNIANETELLPLLAELGFEAVDCSALSFDAQVKLFSEASFVVGPHGAAFTNILWAVPGIEVFEIFEPKAVRRCYWSLCKALGHRHSCGVARSVDSGIAGGEPNIWVDPREFAAALDKALAGKRPGIAVVP